LQRISDLIKHSAKLFKGQDTKRVTSDGDDTFWTLLTTEASRTIECFVGKRRQMESLLMSIRKPRAGRYRKDRIFSFCYDFV